MEPRAMHTVTANEAELAPPFTASCSACHIDMVPTAIDIPMSVRARQGRGPSLPLDAFTCLGCGRTEFFAQRPLRLGALGEAVVEDLFPSGYAIVERWSTQPTLGG